MKHKKIDRYELEEHPFEDEVHDDTKILIIGTFPTHSKNRMFDFYYAGENNYFWKIISCLYRTNFQHLKGGKAISERKKFVEKNKIGFTDMIDVCHRKNEGSSDNSLYPVKLKDIFSILKNTPYIEKLVFTSRTEGISALGLFKAQYYLTYRSKIEVLRNHDDVLEGWMNFEGKDLEIVVPYSPSGIAIQNDWILEKVMKMYRCALDLN